MPFRQPDHIVYRVFITAMLSCIIASYVVFLYNQLPDAFAPIWVNLPFAYIAVRSLECLLGWSLLPDIDEILGRILKYLETRRRIVAQIESSSIEVVGDITDA
ncbi:MAG: hypothetical protein KDA31_02200 [Phycisphaerales bacterium]|nr:hypothetical protein [Phycisphaerales bacterium]MCB9835642.1 hypothetical protein [Phycisphaera sp.]